MFALLTRVCFYATVFTFAQIAYAQTAQNFPNKPVKLVVAFATGGATDVVARVLGQKLSEVWGQNVTVENRVGAGGNIGTEAVAKSTPDGYTITLVSGSVAMNPHMYKAMPYNLEKDMVAISNIAAGPLVMLVTGTSPIKTVAEFIAAAKKEKMTYGSAGIGSQTHLIPELFLSEAGLEAVHVPYKGESQAYADLVGGQIQFMLGNLAGAMPFIKSGRLRAIAVTSAVRSTNLPETPTLAESGIKGFESNGWFGLMGPAGIPPAIVDKIQQDSARVLATPDMKQRLDALGMFAIGNTPKEFTQYIHAESQRWGKLIKAKNITAQ